MTERLALWCLFVAIVLVALWLLPVVLAQAVQHISGRVDSGAAARTVWLTRLVLALAVASQVWAVWRRRKG
jgi:hypothetical protein